METRRLCASYITAVTWTRPPHNKLYHSKCLASDRNVKGKVQRLSDTSAGKTCRHFDCLSCCLTLGFSSSHSCTYCSLLQTHSASLTHSHIHTAVASSVNSVVPCCRLAVTTLMLGLLFGRKTTIGQILFGQIKKSMSSCLHSSTHWPSDDLTNAASPPHPAYSLLSLPFTSISFYLDALPPLSRLCLFSLSSLFLL